MQGEGGFWGRDLPHRTPISQFAAHSAKESHRAGDGVTFSEPLRIITAGRFSSSTSPRLLWGRGLRGLSSTLPRLGLFSRPGCSSSSDAAGAGTLGRAGWVLAGSGTGAPPPCQRVEHKRHLRCVSRYLPQREMSHSHRGSPGSQGKGSQGSIGGSRTSNTLQKYLREPLFSTTATPPPK